MSTASGKTSFFMLFSDIRRLRNSRLAVQINKRLDDFASFRNKPAEEWFSELCFCILTANSKAKTAMGIQNELGYRGFCTLSCTKLSKAIRKNKHRFHNIKASYIADARSHIDIKSRVLSFDNPVAAREWLVKHVKGIGYKEASHFLRNVGYSGLAILDRHILNLMAESSIISEIPKTLTRSAYLAIEEKFKYLAARLHMSPSELDLYMWYLKTGELLK